MDSALPGILPIPPAPSSAIWAHHIVRACARATRFARLVRYEYKIASPLPAGHSTLLFLAHGLQLSRKKNILLVMDSGYRTAAHGQSHGLTVSTHCLLYCYGLFSRRDTHTVCCELRLQKKKQQKNRITTCFLDISSNTLAMSFMLYMHLKKNEIIRSLLYGRPITCYINDLANTFWNHFRIFTFCTKTLSGPSFFTNTQQFIAKNLIHIKYRKN